MSDLAATQRRMHAALTSLDAGGPAAEAGALVHGSPRLSAQQRLELYRRTYHRRLTGCLRDTYPALRHALGDELFDDFALDYLAANPPRGHSLATLGAALPEHLERTRPDHDLPPHRRERWPDLLVDLATLERAFHEVYDGPGVERLTLPSAADVPCDDALTVQLAPCLRVLRARFAVDEYLLAVRRGERPSLPAAQARYVALHRRDWVVALTPLDAAGHALLTRLAAGEPLGAARAAAGCDADDAGERLRGWADRGLLLSLNARAT